MEIIKEVKLTYLFLNHHLRISVIQMDLLPYPEKIQDCLFVCFVALRPKSTATVIAGRSVHLITLFPGQA